MIRPAPPKRSHRQAMLGQADSYDTLVANFRWRIPYHYNIGVDVCDRHAPDAVALIHVDAAGKAHDLTFGALGAAANRLANTLVGHGLKPGDRVGILLGQGPETAIAHVAVYKAGLIAVPLFTLFAFVDDLPRTATGKIRRAELRQRAG